MAIEFYKEFGPLGYLASYSPHGFYKDGIYYKTVEHYYQSHKFNDRKIQDAIINCDTPKEASNIGRRRELPRIPNFNQIKNKVMYDAVFEKFMNNPEIRAKLIETRNEEIKEMTTKESYWGVGPNLDGENNYGKILMEVRENIKKLLTENIIKASIGKTIYIMGHTNSDPDSIFSSVVLSHILKSFGIDAKIAVRDEKFINNELITDFFNEDYELITYYKDKQFILVDHNSLDGLNKDQVIAAIDHHIITGEIDNLIEIEYASCALLIYDLFKDYYNFTLEDKKLIALSVLSDTEFLVSSRFSDEDKKVYEELNVNIDEKEYQKKYFKTNDFTKSYYDNLHNDYKEYNVDGTLIRRSIIASYTGDLDTYYKSYILELQNEGIDLLIWCDYESATTYVYYNGREFEFPFFTTSTNLVLKHLKNEKYL